MAHATKLSVGSQTYAVESSQPELELSVVIPCLNEKGTPGTCLAKAKEAIAQHGIADEMIVANNGSIDRSVECVERLGARVDYVRQRVTPACKPAGVTTTGVESG